MPRRKLSELKNKEGRIDYLLYGLSNLVTTKLESKLNLPGLANGVMPILEHEIKKAVKPNNVIPEQYRELSKVVGSHIDRVLQHSTTTYPMPKSTPKSESESEGEGE